MGATWAGIIRAERTPSYLDLSCVVPLLFGVGMIFFCILLALFYTPLQAQKTAIGKPAPNYATLEWVRPAALPPHAFDGSVVILEFWATWCAPCMKHMPAVMELEQRYKAQGVKVVAVSWDARPTQIDSFVRDHSVPHYVCIDRNNEMFLKQYNERGIPFAIMFGRDGRAVWEGTADSLTPKVIDMYLATNAVPEEPSDDEMTAFSLSVKHARASDKNGVGTDDPVNSELVINAQPPIGLITNAAWFLGLKHARERIKGDPPSGLYNLRMKIDTSLRSDAMRDRCLRQLDDIFGTETTIIHDTRTVYVVSLVDATPALSGGRPTDDSQVMKIRLFNALGTIEQLFEIEALVDDPAIGEQQIVFPSVPSSLESSIAMLEALGYSVRKEDRILPTIVIRRAGE